MEKTYSVTDLKLIPELSHLHPLEFIDPKHTDLIAPYLKVLGFDLDYPIEFIPSQHRNLQGKVVISYQICGHVECNEEFLSSSFATAEDRIIARSYFDPSLARKLQEGQITGRAYGEELSEAFPPDLVNPDESEIKSAILQLENLLLAVRGNPFKNDGSRKTWYEILETEAPEKKRLKTKKAAVSEVANNE